LTRPLIAAALALGALFAADCGGGSTNNAELAAIATAPAPVATSEATAAATATATPPAQAAAPSAAAQAVSSAAASPTAAPATTAATQAATAPAPTPTAPPPSAQTITFTARDIAFDRSEVRVKAGTRVTAIFQNTDAGIEHNLSFSLPGLEHPTCAGPCTTTQNFTASTPGKFAFFCTIHSQMFGDFFIDP
jgi:plastocyanin